MSLPISALLKGCNNDYEEYFGKSYLPLQLKFCASRSLPSPSLAAGLCNPKKAYLDNPELLSDLVLISPLLRSVWRGCLGII